MPGLEIQPWMEKFIWALRYFFLLIRKSILIPFLIGLQAFALLVVPQGKDVLIALSNDYDLVFQAIAFEFSILISGLIYFSGGYWLLFFSDTKGHNYQEPEFYLESHLKIKAWKYHEFIQKHRGYLIRLYTGFLLFSPLMIQLAAYSFIDFSLDAWFFTCFSSFSCFLLVIYARNNRSFFLVKACGIVFSGISKNLEEVPGILKKQFSKWFLPASIGLNGKVEPNFQYSITTEEKVRSFFNAFSSLRGAFYVKLGLALVILVLLLGLPENAIEQLGPATILVLGLCFWAVFLIWIGFLNKLFLFPFFFFIGFWILINSYFNSDHPIWLQKEKSTIASSKPQTIDQTFENWLSTRKGFKPRPEGGFYFNGEIFDEKNCFKYLVINAEGGANRSAYWTALLLDSLRGRLGPAFDERLFALSSVSGGSMGTLSYLEARKGSPDSKISRQIRQYFKEDFLSVLNSRLLVGEVFNSIFPLYNRNLDRAFAFEKSIDNKIRQHFSSDPQKNPSFNDLAFNKLNSDLNPVVLLNATESESGKKAILSNVNFKSGSFPNSTFLSSVISQNISTGTAIHLGARFPLFSPSAAIEDESGNVRHYVDGGYYDNGGYETTLEMLESIQNSKWGKIVKPVVITLSNEFENEEVLFQDAGLSGSEKEKNTKGVFFLNEIQSVFSALVKIRSANTETHKSGLIRFLKNENQSGIFFVDFNLKALGREIPLSWYLSSGARKKIENRVEAAMEKTTGKLTVKNMFNSRVDSRPILAPAVKPESKENGNTEVRRDSKKLVPSSNTVNSGLVSQSTHPYLYYYSKSRKEWRLKSEADFDIKKMKPYKKGRKRRRIKEEN